MKKTYGLIGSLSGTQTLLGGLSNQQNLISGSLDIPDSVLEPYELPPATTNTLGGVIVGENLLVTEGGVLSVDVANDAEEDNTRPITAAAVYTEIGNINVLLSTI